MVEYSSVEMLRATLGALSDDLPASAVKLGMLGTETVMNEVADALEKFDGPVVCDPVMISTSGRKLIDDGAQQVLKTRIFPRATIVTPNLHEAEALLGRKLECPADVEAGAAELLATGCGSVLIKGGHSVKGDDDEASQDYWTDGKSGSWWLSTPRVPTMHTHGTGCTLSSAIATAMAHGYGALDAVVIGKAYVTQGIKQVPHNIEAM